MTKLAKISIVFAFALVLSACNLKNQPSTNETKTQNSDITTDTSDKSIETDLKDTVIVEEDFSDIK